MAFSAAESKLVSIFIQTLLYGAYVVVFTLTCWVLVKKRPRGQPINKTMFSISFTMFIIATLHIAVNYTRIFMAFIIYADAPGGPSAFFNILSNFTQIFGSTLYVAQTLVGDSIVVYRCYLVWGNHWWIIAFPCLLLLGSTASGIGILYSFARIVPDAEIFVIKLQQWIVAFFSLTLATNIICTSLHAWRIWWINRASISFSDRSLNPIMLLVIESGAIYSATLITLLVLYKAESWFQYVILDAVSPIVGLVFSMVIVRIGMGITSVSGQTGDFTRTSRLQTRDPTAPSERSMGISASTVSDRVELGSSIDMTITSKSFGK